MGQTVNLLATPTVVRIHHCPQIIIAGIAQSIEHQPSKLRVAGLSPVSRSKATWSCRYRNNKASTVLKKILLKKRQRVCCCSSAVEHFLGKEEVMGSSPINSSRKNDETHIYLLINNFLSYGKRTF